MPHDVGGPDDDPFYRPNWYQFQDVNDWKDLGPEVRAPGLARRRRRRRRPRRRAHPRGVADRRGAADAACRRATATATACPSTTACPTRPTTPGRCTGRRPTAARSGWAPWPRPRRWPSGSATPRRRAAGRAGSSAARSPSTGRLWRGDHYAYDDGGGAELGQHHGRPARRPVVRRRDRARRPAARRPGRGRPADDPPR